MGATPSFLGYHGFPAVICTSVNDEVVHGIPGPRVLHECDLISIDCGAIVDGWHGDAAVSVPVGAVTAEVAELSRVTEASMWAGLAKARAGGRLSDIGHAVEQVIIAAGDYGIVEEYVGHGIGTSMHMHHPVPNYGKAGQGPHLKVWMALAIEPWVKEKAQEFTAAGAPGPELYNRLFALIQEKGGKPVHVYNVD